MGLEWGMLKKGKPIVKQTVPFHSFEQNRKHCIDVPERRGKKSGHHREIRSLEVKSPKLSRTDGVILVLSADNLHVHR